MNFISASRVESSHPVNGDRVVWSYDFRCFDVLLTQLPRGMGSRLVNRCRVSPRPASHIRRRTNFIEISLKQHVIFTARKLMKKESTFAEAKNNWLPRVFFVRSHLEAHGPIHHMREEHLNDNRIVWHRDSPFLTQRRLTVSVKVFALMFLWVIFCFFFFRFVLVVLPSSSSSFFPPLPLTRQFGNTTTSSQH